MAVVARTWKASVINGLLGQNLYIMLLNSTHTPLATQQYISDVSANQITDSGGVYTAGGIQISGKVQSYDPLNTNNAFLDSTVNLSIGPGANLNYRYGIIYINTGTPASSPIVCQIDFLTNQIVTNGTSIIEWNSLGIIYLQ